ERDRLAHAAWKEYDACAPSGCLRMRGILLARSPRILRLQTVFRILTSAHSCRIRVYSMQLVCGPQEGQRIFNPTQGHINRCRRAKQVPYLPATVARELRANGVDPARLPVVARIMSS